MKKKFILIFITIIIMVGVMAGCKNTQTENKRKNENLNRKEVISLLEEKGYILTEQPLAEGQKFLVLENNEEKRTLVYFSETQNDTSIEEMLYKNYNLNDSDVDLLIDVPKDSAEKKEQNKDFEKWIQENGVTKEQIISIFKGEEK